LVIVGHRSRSILKIPPEIDPVWSSKSWQIIGVATNKRQQFLQVTNGGFRSSW
jgi:hypothetical protein